MQAGPRAMSRRFEAEGGDDAPRLRAVEALADFTA